MTENRISKQAIRNHMALTGDSYSAAHRASEFFPLSSWLSLDRFTGGFHRGGLYAFTGRTGVGKTALASSLALELAKGARKVAYFSLEVSGRDLTESVLSAGSGLPLGAIEEAPAELLEETRRTMERSMLIHANPWIDLNALRCCLIADPSVDAVVLDYYQLARGRGIDGTVLKSLAKEFNVAVIVMYQSTRNSVRGISTETELAYSADLIAELEGGYRSPEESREKTLSLAVVKNRYGLVGETLELSIPDDRSRRIVDTLIPLRLKPHHFETKWFSRLTLPFFESEHSADLWAHGLLSDEEFLSSAKQYDELCGVEEEGYGVETIELMVGVGAMGGPRGDWRIYPAPVTFPGAIPVKRLSL